MIIDTHIHLNDKSYNNDLEEVILRAKNSGVKTMIIPGANPEELDLAKEISSKYENIYFAIGVHPYDIESYDEEYLLKFSQDEKCIAVGECGLDYYRLPDDEEEKKQNIALQKDIFIKQIKLAKKLKKPLIVHIRDASLDAKEILVKEDAKEVGGVLHCFNANSELLSLSEHNFYFGIGGVLTFKNAKKLVNILPQIPKDKLVLETDGPYLTPHPHRGTRNEPSYTILVAQKISEILDIPFEEVEKITTNNSKKLFKID